MIENGLDGKECYLKSRIDVFKVDDDKGHILFTFKNDNHLFIYDYCQRRVIWKLEVIPKSIFSGFGFKED